MKKKQRTLIGIDIGARGFGLAVIREGFGLVEQGFSRFKGKGDVDSILRAGAVINRVMPSAIVMESILPNKKRQRTITCQRMIGEYVRPLHIASVFVSQMAVRHVLGGTTKREIAEMIAKMFPELEWRLPPPRKRWKSEDERTRIFGAVALALTVERSLRGVDQSV